MCFESLEDRRLFAVLVGTQLVVTGGAGVDVVAVSQFNAATIRVVQNGVTQFFADAAVASIRINGNAGNDNLSLFSTPALPLTEPATMIGGIGNDIMRGGAGPDSMFGGSGNDTALGNDGNDVMSGGSGNDILLGGNGNDVLTGGIGVDQLRGEAGNDVLLAQDGGFDSVLDGGSGFDIVERDAGDAASIGAEIVLI